MSQIQLYEQMLREAQSEKNSGRHAALLGALGIAYSSLLVGDRAANLERAITYFWEALRFCTPEDARAMSPEIQNNLGLAYLELPTGDRTANLEQAISCFREALRYWTAETGSTEYAVVQANLGLAYFNLPTGDRTANLEQAISYFREALRFRTPESSPLGYARAQHGLGDAYQALPTGDRAANLEQAINYFQEALRFYRPESSTFDYALLQNDLGVAYRKLPTGDHSANLEKAIACYREALRFYTPESSPRDYAMTQLNLGTAHLELPTGDRSANVEQAISCFQEVLRFWTPERSPLDYALAQNNLGLAYRDLPTGDRSANVEQAISCYREALRFYTPESSPRDYAMTQLNLGTAHLELPTGDRSANVEQAISCFQEVLRFQTPESSPLDYALAQNNLGLAYRDLPTGDRSANVEQAISCYREALRFYAPESSPRDYAMTQNNLGLAYLELPTGDRAANVEQAISCDREALRFWTPESSPRNYALAQSNLGLAYRDLPTGDHSANVEQAISCFREASRFCTPEGAPFDYRRICHTLADLHFARREWQAAFDAYQAAMLAGERLYRAGLSTESKAIEIAENAELYRYAAFAAVRSGRSAAALLILEQGKTRLLTEALRLRIARPTDIPDEVWNTFEAAAAVVRTAQSKSTTMFGEGHGLIEAYSARERRVQAANAALDTSIEHIQVHAPNFLRTLDLSEILALLQDEYTVLVAFCITDQGSIGFVVSQNQEIQVVEVPTFTQTDVRRLFVEWDADGRPSGGWLGAYVRYLTDHTTSAFEAWQETIIRVLTKLGERLLSPILSTLSANIKRIILLPSAELFLFPLHSVPLTDNGPELVCDCYQVSYAPSIEVLLNIRARAAREVTPQLYAVVNPEADPKLIFSSTEGAAIAKLFEEHTVDQGQKGTKQRVIESVRGPTYVHFSCHGSYDRDDPPQSGLALADGRLTLNDLQQGTVDLSAVRLVTLSACETGMSDVIQGSAEEYVGISAGFLLAGVPCIVASLWAVPELSTAMLMERFYQNHLSRRMSFAEALREAQAWVRELRIGEVVAYTERCYEQSPPVKKPEYFRFMRYYQHQAKDDPTLRPFAHPYYWAAFTMNGL